MPGKSRSTDTAALVSDEAIRQRAYFLWENDGRPEGRGDHYWHLARQEADKTHREMVEDTATRTAKFSKGKNPAEMPAEVKAKDAKRRGAKAAKPAALKKTPKPRAAIQKAP
jgi:hypothetical protein